MTKLQIPDVLRDILDSRDMGAILMRVNGKTALIVKMTREEAESCQNSIVSYWFEGGFYKEGAIIALVMEIHDKPDSFLLLDTFLNPGNIYDQALAATLIGQKRFDIHFIDRSLNYIYTKRLRFRRPIRRDLENLLSRALSHNKKRDRAIVSTEVFEVIRRRYMADRPR